MWLLKSSLSQSVFAYSCIIGNNGSLLQDWGYSQLVEHLLSKHMTLDSISSAEGKKNPEKLKQNIYCIYLWLHTHLTLESKTTNSTTHLMPLQQLPWCFVSHSPLSVFCTLEPSPFSYIINLHEGDRQLLNKWREKWWVKEWIFLCSVRDIHSLLQPVSLKWS